MARYDEKMVGKLLNKKSTERRKDLCIRRRRNERKYVCLKRRKVGEREHIKRKQNNYKERKYKYKIVGNSGKIIDR